MISVFILDDGSIAYRCSKCDKTKVINISLSDSVWWEMYNGMAILELLAHYQSCDNHE